MSLLTDVPARLAGKRGTHSHKDNDFGRAERRQRGKKRLSHTQTEMNQENCSISAMVLSSEILGRMNSTPSYKYSQQQVYCGVIEPRESRIDEMSLSSSVATPLAAGSGSADKSSQWDNAHAFCTGDYRGDNISFNELNDGICSIIITYCVEGNIALKLVSLQRICHKWKALVQGKAANEAWTLECHQKFSGLFNASTRDDYIHLEAKIAHHAAWIIQRAMGFYHRLHQIKNIWLTQTIMSGLDPRCICGVRWNENSFDRCQIDACPGRKMLQSCRVHNKYYGGKSLYCSRLFVCETCGSKHPDKAMKSINLGLNDDHRLTACIICVRRVHHATWIIQRVMGRHYQVKQYKNILRSWTTQMVMLFLDP